MKSVVGYIPWGIGYVSEEFGNNSAGFLSLLGDSARYIFNLIVAN
jgi:hypothetical protein